MCKNFLKKLRKCAKDSEKNNFIDKHTQYGYFDIRNTHIGDTRFTMNIKEMRELTGQTQKEFADSLGIPIGTIRRWEYGESTPAPYLIRMIANMLPQENSSLRKIESAEGKYYYDKTRGTITDVKGISIKIGEDLDNVKEQNLIIYANTLFESYYDAVDKFNRDCKIDKTEDIIWG